MKRAEGDQRNDATEAEERRNRLGRPRRVLGHADSRPGTSRAAGADPYRVTPEPVAGGVSLWRRPIVGSKCGRMKTSTRIQYGLLALGGVAFIVAGPMHPSDSGTGSKTHQLHEMLLDPAWYPAHSVMLLAVVLATVGLWAIHRDAAARMQTLTKVVAIVSSVMVVGTVIHLLQPLNADGIADGNDNAMSILMYFVEPLDGIWALSLAVLAVVGGLTRSVGNIVTASLCTVGAIGFSIAAFTIPYTDRFDPLFPMGGLLGLWMIVIGVSRAVRPPEADHAESTPGSPPRNVGADSPIDSRS